MGKGKGGKGKSPGAGKGGEGKGTSGREHGNDERSKGKGKKGKFSKHLKGLTRKERKKIVLGKGKGGTKGDGKSKGGAPTKLGEGISKKRKADALTNAVGNTSDTQGEKKTKRLSQAARKRRLKRMQERGEALDEKVEAAPSVGNPDAVLCKWGHAMAKMSKNPERYTNKACCDICGLENLPKKALYFYHCAVCRWDICPVCATEKKNPEKKRKKKKLHENSAGNQVDKTPGPRDEFSRSRRETLANLPTEETAVARAPKSVSVVSSWVEGQPV